MHEIPTPPLLIGERINAQGSRRARRLLLARDYQGIVELAREQIAAGVHALDVCVAMPEQTDEASQMAAVVRHLSDSVGVPIVVDTTDPAVVARALAEPLERVIVNSIDLSKGRARADLVLPLVKRSAARIVALTIDEAGPALSVERKLAIARRIYGIVVGDHGIAPDALLIDPLTFTLGTGKAEWRDSAAATIESIDAIKRELRGVATLLGISDVSFALPPGVRPVLNSVFLHLCVRAGLDAAIVDPARISPADALAERDRRLAEDLLLHRTADALRRFADGAGVDGRTP